MCSTPSFAAAIIAATLAAFPLAAPTQQPPSGSHTAVTEKLNQNTVTVISGNPNGAYLYLAYDMSAVLDDGNELRVLPVIGKAAIRTCWTFCTCEAWIWASRNQTS